MKEEMEENRERQTDRPPPAVLKNSLHFSVYQVKISPIKQFFNLLLLFFLFPFSIGLNLCRFTQCAPSLETHLASFSLQIFKKKVFTHTRARVLICLAQLIVLGFFFWLDNQLFYACGNGLINGYNYGQRQKEEITPRSTQLS